MIHCLEPSSKWFVAQGSVWVSQFLHRDIHVRVGRALPLSCGNGLADDFIAWVGRRKTGLGDYLAWNEISRLTRSNEELSVGCCCEEAA